MKKTLFLLLILLGVLKVNNAQQRISYMETFSVMKDYIAASVKMTKNHPNGIVAKNVKSYYGNNALEIEYYTFVFDFSTKESYYCVLDTASSIFCKVDKKNWYSVNKATRELTHYKSSNLREYKSMKGTLETQHKVIEYYIYGNKYIKPDVNYVLYKKTTDTIIRTKPCMVFYASNFSDDFRRDAEYYVDKTNYELDSVIWVSIETNGKRTIIGKEVVSDIENFNTEELKDLFDFNNPKYAEFSRHDKNNLPPSFAYSENVDFSLPKVTNFEFSDLNNNKTSLQKEQGWVLLDIWEFGCKGCYAGFKRMGQQIDSIGQTVLEKNGVKVICVNPMSDNMEYIGNVADKYNVRSLLYAGKGFKALIDVPSFPSYYLISPQKKMVKKGVKFTDEEILEAIKQYK